MQWMRAVCFAGVCVALGGCGARQGLSPADDPEPTGVDGGAAVGAIDLSQAPPELALQCDHGVGQVAFVNPCLVGMNLAGTAKVGVHAVECRLADSGQPVVWSFVLPLARIAARPDRSSLSFPGDFPPVPAGSGGLTVLGGQKASVSGARGTVTFSRVDPMARAFVAHFAGTVTWQTASGSTFSCAVDGPFWGAPGDFL